MEETTSPPVTTNNENPPPPWAWIRAVNDVIVNAPWETQSPPVEILPWLYLSDFGSVRAFDPIQGKGKILEQQITHVLSTNSMSPETLQALSRKLAAAGIAHKAISAQDEEGYDMIGRHWEECRAFIEQARTTPGGKVVVHCQAGQNRSGLIVTAAHMVSENMTVLEAVKKIKAQRGIFLTNLSFQKQICEFAQKEGLLGEKPSGYADTEVTY